MWHTYKNGNVKVSINDFTGTRIMETTDDEFKPVFPLNIDCHISYKCDYNCGFCYAGCTPKGKHSDLLSYKFIDTLHSYTEIALNLNSEVPPNFIKFLYKLKDKHIITNLTVNQKFFDNNFDFIKELYDKKLIYGLGVSLVNPTCKFIENIKKIPSAVVHVINGIFNEVDYNFLKGNNLKLLILGYKMKNRGAKYFTSDKMNTIVDNEEFLYKNLPYIINSNDFKVVAFDCLAMNQLNVKKILNPELYNLCYQGDDGTITFAIDMVKGTFSTSSTSNIEFPIMDNVNDMFKVVLAQKTGVKNAI